MYAVKSQNVLVAKELLLAGADRNARDKGGRTVVELAEEQGCEEMVELFQQQALVSDTSVSGGRGKEVEMEVGRGGGGRREGDGEKGRVRDGDGEEGEGEEVKKEDNGERIDIIILICIVYRTRLCSFFQPTSRKLRTPNPV